MADEKISLIPGTTIAGGEKIVVAKSGDNFTITPDQQKVFGNTDISVKSTASKGISNEANWAQNLVPGADGEVLPSLEYIQPLPITISTAAETLDSDTQVNQFAMYTGAGGNITIESSFLKIGQEYVIHQEGANQFTLVPGAGVSLHEPDSLLTSSKQYANVGIFKKTATTYAITGDLV